MKVFIAVLFLAAVANAGLIAGPVISRAPSLDSAVIQSDRIGGNFAYSVAEGHSFVAQTPIIQNVAQPVAISYSAPIVAPSAVVAARTVVHSAPVLHVATAHAPALTLAAHPIALGSPAATIKIA